MSSESKMSRELVTITIFTISHDSAFLLIKQHLFLKPLIETSSKTRSHQKHQ